MRHDELEHLADEGLGAPDPADEIGDAEAAAEPGGLVALLHVPEPLEAGLRIVLRDPVRRERQADGVVGEPALGVELRLAGARRRGVGEELRRGVVGEARPDLEPHALVEEALALLPEEGGHVVLQHGEAIHLEHVARRERDGRRVLGGARREASAGRVAAPDRRERPRTGRCRRCLVGGRRGGNEHESEHGAGCAQWGTSRSSARQTSESRSWAPRIRSGIATPTGQTPRQGPLHEAQTEAFFASCP